MGTFGVINDAFSSCTTLPNCVFVPNNTNSMHKSFWDHPVETIEKALHIRKQIVALEASLVEIVGGDPKMQLPFLVVKDVRKGKRSASVRAKMAAAQQARWAKKKSSPVVKTPKAKRVVSASSRKKMVASQRARRTKEKIAPELSMPNKLIW